MKSWKVIQQKTSSQNLNERICGGTMMCQRCFSICNDEPTIKPNPAKLYSWNISRSPGQREQKCDVIIKTPALEATEGTNTPPHYASAPRAFIKDNKVDKVDKNNGNPAFAPLNLCPGRSYWELLRGGSTAAAAWSTTAAYRSNAETVGSSAATYGSTATAEEINAADADAIESTAVAAGSIAAADSIAASTWSTTGAYGNNTAVVESTTAAWEHHSTCWEHRSSRWTK